MEDQTRSYPPASARQRPVTDNQLRLRERRRRNFRNAEAFHRGELAINYLNSTMRGYLYSKYSNDYPQFKSGNRKRYVHHGQFDALRATGGLTPKI